MQHPNVAILALLTLTGACAARPLPEATRAPAHQTRADTTTPVAAPSEPALRASGGPRITELTSPPTGEIVDQAAAPACKSLSDDDVGKSVEITVEGHELRLTWEADMKLSVTEGVRHLWTGDFSHAGPIAATFCARDGWRVITAGESRMGNSLYDVFTGEDLGPADELVVDPSGSWAIVPPAWSYFMSCYTSNRPFRLPVTSNGTKKWLDTPARPVSTLCESDGRDEAERVDAVSMAISPDGAFYAYVDPFELTIYRASDDKKIASLPNPPLEIDQQSFHDAHLLSFSRSGRYLVLQAIEGSPDPVWFEIDQG